MYYYGNLVKKADKKKAYFWFLKAAENGHPKAQHNIAYMYYIGENPVVKDEKKAIFWWKKSANSNSKISQIAQRYLSEINFKNKKYKRGIYWLKKSAIEDPYSQFRLGEIYLKGLHGEKVDKVEALNLFKKAKDVHPEAKKRYEELTK